jgi:carbon monoxide dehydrogenase subunit G
VVLDEPLPLGVLVLDDAAPLDGVDGDVELLPVDPLTEPEPVVVLLRPGVVVAPGEADGVDRSGVLPTRSVSVRLHATLAPASSASAQKPDSIFFIANAPPCGVSSHREGVATGMPAVGWLDRLRSIQYYCELSRAPVRAHPRRRRGLQMKLEGSHDVLAPRQKVWDAFLDPERLRQAIPGCEKLEALGNDEYKATMKVGVGGVKGTFEGKVRLSDKKPPESYKMAVEGTGGPGFVRGESVITLSDIAGGTRVSYNADLQVGGLIASVGQRMLGGVSKMMADKFFGKMGELLQA